MIVSRGYKEDVCAIFPVIFFAASEICYLEVANSERQNALGCSAKVFKALFLKAVK